MAGPGRHSGPPREPASLPGARADGDIERARAAATASCQALLIELSGEFRRPNTLENLKNPAYKALWWWACMDRRLPPSSEDVADYLAFLSARVDTEGSAADARGAIGFLATVNAGRGWVRGDILGGRAALPLEALRRRHAHAVSKAPGLPASIVRQVIERYVVVRSDLSWDRQWRLAVGVAVGAAFTNARAPQR